MVWTISETMSSRILISGEDGKLYEKVYLKRKKTNNGLELFRRLFKKRYT